MKLKVFTVYDSKAEAYKQPFFMQATGEAIRAITSLTEEPGHNFNKYSSDYTLFQIGEYDDSTGNITTLPAKINLGILTEFKKEVTPIQQGH